jgi:Rps23 Pro-64 3,4-dihydroxylase Tpa1-like proline 4-hydroxylase
METTTTNILSPALEFQAEKFAREFKTATPFRHVVIQEFFSPEFCRRVLEDFPAFEDQYARNEMGEVGRKAARSGVRELSPVYRQLDDFLQTDQFLHKMSEITGIPDLLYDPDYEGGGTHENLEGQGLAPHVDFNYHPRTGWHRRLNLIVYLNPEWKEEWGGNLDLHANAWDTEGDEVKTVLPLLNSGVIFETTERSWHGFTPIRLPEGAKDVSRKSFAIYLYTEDRPEEEIAASHATVYVPPTMPDDVQPDQVLTEEQYRTIQGHFAHHRALLEFQYEREQDFSAQVENLLAALRQAKEESREGVRLDLQGYAVQTGPPTGIFHDGWASEELEFEFTPTRPVSGLKLEVGVPARLGGAQTLEIDAGEWHDSRKLRPGEETTLELPISADPGESVKVTVRASASWRPADDGTSDDDRPLAFRLGSAVLDH